MNNIYEVYKILHDGVMDKVKEFFRIPYFVLGILFIHGLLITFIYIYKIYYQIS